MKEVKPAAGDSVVFLSDGLLDRTDHSGEIPGIEPVMELLSAARKKEPAEILRSLFSYAEAYSEGHTQQDDRTAAVLRYL